MEGSRVDGDSVKGPGVKGEGDTEFVVPKSELWDILSEATDRSKSRIGQADFAVETIACLQAGTPQSPWADLPGTRYRQPSRRDLSTQPTQYRAEVELFDY